MKNNATIFNPGNCSQILSPYTRGREAHFPLLFKWKKLFLSKNFLTLAGSTLGIGLILLSSIYLFFRQLAQYGW